MASREGWEFSDLARALVFLGTTATWLSLARKKNLEVLREVYALGGMRRVLEKHLLGAVESRRPYPLIRSGRDTSVITLILPVEVAGLIESYASTKTVSKNDLCENLLTKGLVMYLAAEQRLLRALQKVTDRTERPSAAI